MKTEVGQDGFGDDLQSAVVAMMPSKEKLLQLSDFANVEFLVQIFKERHAVFALDRELFASLSNLELSVYFKYYNNDCKARLDD